MPPTPPSTPISHRHVTPDVHKISEVTTSELVSSRISAEPSVSSTYTTVADEPEEPPNGEGEHVSATPRIVALQTLRGSFALTGAPSTFLRTSGLRSSNKKLGESDTTHRDDLTEERRYDRPVMASPGREVIARAGRSSRTKTSKRSSASYSESAAESASGTSQPVVRRRISSAFSSRAPRRKRTCLADILDSRGDRLETLRIRGDHLEVHDFAVSGPPPTIAGSHYLQPDPDDPRNQYRRFSMSLLWSKKRRNHRNERISSGRAPGTIEQWWADPSTSMSEGVKNVIGGLRRSLMRQQV